MSKKILVGHCAVDSGQILFADPCYLKEFENDAYKDKDKDLRFSYNGASHASQDEKGGAELYFNDSRIDHAGVCVSSGGDGIYPVYVELNEDNRVIRATIEFIY